MQRSIENSFICMTRNCANMSALVQDIDEIEFHPEHKIVKIKTLRDQLNDPNHRMNKFLQLKTDLMTDIDKKIQEIIQFCNALIHEYENKIKKQKQINLIITRLAQDSSLIYQGTTFLINAVNSLETQVIQDNSKAISQLFSMEQMEIEQKVKETADMKLRENEQTERLKEQMRKLFQSIDLTNNQQEAIQELQLGQYMKNKMIKIEKKIKIEEQFNQNVIQKWQWSERMKNQNIVIIQKTAVYGQYDHYGHSILVEPRLDFNSTQSFKVKFHAGHKNWNGGIILVDLKIQRAQDTNFIKNGLYILSRDGSKQPLLIISFLAVYYEGIQLPSTAFKFSQNELIEVFWDGPSKQFGIKKIGEDDNFKIKIEFSEDSEIYFGVDLWRSNCTIV